MGLGDGGGRDKLLLHIVLAVDRARQIPERRHCCLGAPHGGGRDVVADRVPQGETFGAEEGIWK